MAQHLSHAAGEPDELAPLAEINVTPFVDVMLVLLVIFILTAPLLMTQLPIKLPRASLETMAKPPAPVVVSMDAQGDYYIDSAQVPYDQFLQRLHGMAEQQPDNIVYVRADRALPYGKVVHLLELVGAAGFSRVSLVSQAPQ